MKKLMIFGIVIPLLIFIVSGCGGYYTYTNNPEQTYRELDYYGTWINVSPWGEVWQPDGLYDWAPYENGQWQLTGSGWEWDSDEPFGWIVYHYGNWVSTNSDGWLWVPGYNWYPSRVRWMMDNDYIGWAPLPPRGDNLPPIYNNYGSRIWTVVHAQDFRNREVGKYRINDNRIIGRQDWVNRAPDAGFVSRATGRNINPVTAQSENIIRGQHSLYRDRFNNSNRQSGNAAQYGNNSRNNGRAEAGREQNRQQAAQNVRSNSGGRNETPRSR